MTGDQERKSVVLETWMTMDPQEERLAHLKTIPEETGSLAPSGNPPERLAHLQAISKEAVSSLAPAGNPADRLHHLQAISKEAETSSCTLVTKEGERTEVGPTFMAHLI